MRVCSIPGCPNITPVSRCIHHQTQARRNRYQTNNVYSSKAHRTFRATVLNRDPICVICHKAEATVADHHPHSRQQLTELGMNPNNPHYGRGLCAKCHNKQTAIHQPGGWNSQT